MNENIYSRLLACATAERKECNSSFEMLSFVFFPLHSSITYVHVRLMCVKLQRGEETFLKINTSYVYDGHCTVHFVSNRFKILFIRADETRKIFALLLREWSNDWAIEIYANSACRWIESLFSRRLRELCRKRQLIKIIFWSQTAALSLLREVSLRKESERERGGSGFGELIIRRDLQQRTCSAFTMIIITY